MTLNTYLHTTPCDVPDADTLHLATMGQTYAGALAFSASSCSTSCASCALRGLCMALSTAFSESFASAVPVYVDCDRQHTTHAYVICNRNHATRAAPTTGNRTVEIGRVCTKHGFDQEFLLPLSADPCCTVDNAMPCAQSRLHHDTMACAVLTRVNQGARVPCTGYRRSAL